MELTNKLLPHIGSSCRIVQVSSGTSKLLFQPKGTQERFRNPDIKEEEIFQGVKEFYEAIEQRNMEKWHCHSYATSKMLLNAWSRFVLK